MDAVKLLNSLLNNNSMGSNVLGGLLGGGGSKSGGGGLGALAGMLGGGGGGQGGGGGLGALASMLGGGSKAGGGGGLGALAGMLGGGGGGSQGGGGGLLGGLMGMVSGGGGGDAEQEPAAQPAPQEVEDEATLLVRAMCQAAKADGRLDEDEKQKILGRLGDVTQDEIDFVQGELSSPVDVAGLAADVPSDSALRVYAFSVMAIKLDEQSEARYLADLAQGLKLDAESCNTIHDRLEAPRIFA